MTATRQGKQRAEADGPWPKANDPDVANVHAALGDASLAGGLSKEYYQSASRALGRIEQRLESPWLPITPDTEFPREDLLLLKGEQVELWGWDKEREHWVNGPWFHEPEWIRAEFTHYQPARLQEE